jgi:YkoY family integral membrane protein
MDFSWLQPEHFATIGLLIFLEGILSLDNALVLAVLARDLPPEQRKRALTYGLVGAFVFRIIAIALVSHLLALNWIKFVGGGYLIFVALKGLLKKEEHEEHLSKKVKRGFWATVVVIELTDIAFALDSILAAVALTKETWIVITGGIIGMVMMRFASTLFLKLLDRFPNFERTAFLLVFVIGTKVIIEGFHPPGIDFHSMSNPGFLTFWGLMLACIAYGFMGGKKKGA